MAVTIPESHTQTKGTKQLMEWFESSFLPSLYERKKMVHGKWCTCLTDKQADVCRRYMQVRECHGDYGDFYIFECVFNCNKVQLCESGKYNILYW